MKKKFLLIIYLSYALVHLSAQEFTGIHSSPYLPFVGIINQPAELTRHEAKWNINLLAGNVGLLQSQSFASGDFWDTMGKLGFSDLKFFLASEESLLFMKGRLIIPSITFKLNERHSFGLMTSVRADGVYNSSNDDFAKLFTGIDDPEGLKDLNDEYFKSLVNSWVEYGFVWSSTFIKDENNWLTGGVVLKILNGSGAGYLEMDGIDVMFDKDRISHFDMNLTYGFNESLSKTVDGGDIIEQSGDMGIGLDLGLSYSYLPDHLAGLEGVPYRYKVGLVVADIGHINHKKTKNQASYAVSMNDVPYERFRGVETIEALKDSLLKSVDIEERTGGHFKTNLPLTLAGNLDYCIRPNWFVNTTVVYRPNYYNSLVELVKRSIWRTNITFRYETQKWGAYLPVSHSSALGWNAGISARYRNFFMGSSTFLGNLLSKGNGQQTVYFGMSIPIGSLNE